MANTFNALTTGTGGIATAGDSTGAFAFTKDGGTASVTIDATGNVGVGTTTPTTKLEVDFSGAGTTIASAPVLTLKNTSYTNNCVTGIVAQNSQGGNAAGIDFINTNQVTDGSGASGAIQFWQNTSGTKSYGMALAYNNNFQFNSGYGSVATAYGCRAWANFNGNSGASPVIRGSGGVTSVTRTGTGAYTVALSFTMPDTNYNIVMGCNNGGGSSAIQVQGGITTSTTSFTIQGLNAAGTAVSDILVVNFAVFR